MKTWKWLPVVSATLLAGAVFAQSGVASAIGCIYTENFHDSLLIRNCVDGSGGGAAKFLSLDTVTGIKTYRLQANLKANSFPSQNRATTELFKAAGQPASLSVFDDNTGASAVQKDLGVPFGTQLTVFRFTSGDGSGT
jgi:hypothetical protein